MIQILLAGLTLGFISSLHCVGMCGPLALALPVHQLRYWQKIFAHTLYNIGRVATYTILGLLFGSIGKGFYLAGWQQAFSVATGTTMLLFIVFYFGLKRKLKFKWIQSFNWSIQKSIGHFLQKQNYSSYFLLGSANGLLPCGMVYIALGAALLTGDAGNSALFMAAFGFATVPAMLLLASIGTSINIAIRNKIKKITPFVMATVAILLIARGLSLGIPYISPDIQPHYTTATPVYCH